MELAEETWLELLTEGCRRIGRNLNDTRGLIHSFRDCGNSMRGLFRDLEEMICGNWEDWENFSQWLSWPSSAMDPIQ